MLVRICFGKNDKFWAIGSKLVRAVEKTDSSHTWIQIGDYCYEAVWPRSRAIKQMDHASHYETVREYAFHFPDEKKSEILNFIYQNLNKKYSTFQLFTIFLGNSSKWLNNHLADDPINGKSEIICTELCARFMHEFLGVKFDEDFDMIGIADLEYECKILELALGGYK